MTRATTTETTDEMETQVTEQVNDTTTHAAGDGLDELVEDPQDCEHCVAEGGPCLWHAGFQAGWDLCTKFVAHHARNGGVELEPAAGGEGAA